MTGTVEYYSDRFLGRACVKCGSRVVFPKPDKMVCECGHERLLDAYDVSDELEPIEKPRTGFV